MNKLLILGLLMAFTLSACGDGGELVMPTKNTPVSADASAKKPLLLSTQALQFHKICPTITACSPLNRYPQIFQMLANNPIKTDDEASDDAGNTVKTPIIGGSVLHNQIMLFGK